jgi:phage terminase small subunit
MSNAIKRRARRSTRRKPTKPGQSGGLPLKRQRAAESFVGEAKGNKTRAMKKAGFAPTTAEHKQAQVFNDPRVQQEIRKLLLDVGLTDEVAVKKHKALLDAEVTKFFKDRAVANTTDNRTQLEALTLYYELTGRVKRGVEINVVVQQWTERVLLVVERYVPVDKRAECLDQIIADLLAPGRN